MTLALILSIVLAAAAVILLLRERRHNKRKLDFLLAAVAANDFAFKFHSTEGSDALNRIAELLHKTRDEVREHEKYYEHIMNQVNTGILIVDGKENILLRNREALRLLGIEVLTHIRQLARIDPQLEHAVATIQPGEQRHVTLQNERGQSELSLRASSATLRGKPVRIVTLSNINQEVDDSQMEAWNKLIRVLTHEIMNTVTPITSLSETLMAKAADSEVKDGLNVIRTTSRDLLDFVENYRRLTHLPTPQPKPFYVQAFAERMRRIAQEQPDAQTIDIGIDVSPTDLLVYADERLITHVVTNLLKNAIQAITASGVGSHVRMVARADADESVSLCISNDGPLIPPEVAEQIFVPFFTTKHDGSGIGLSISRQIMKISGGTLSLKSDNKHRLTTFELKFP